ncbi:hypothetical protein G6046_20010, partial [Bacillus amyloliquefaciens]|nr:hypothetical protein [Bacillus amyloliquefaciens]
YPDEQRSVHLTGGFGAGTSRGPGRVLGTVEVVDGGAAQAVVARISGCLPSHLVFELKMDDQISAVDDAGKCRTYEMT